MRHTLAKSLGGLAIAIGVLVVVFSEAILFRGLGRIIGVEAIVGRENVIYQSDGRWLLTNPGAMIHWIGFVSAVGILICIAGIALIWKTRKARRSPA